MMEEFSDNPKYIAIKTKGKELFWKHGVKRISIEEICREAKVSKMTFYKFFPNKIELAKSILDDLMSDSITKFDELTNSNLPFSEILEAMFLMKMEAVKDFSQEFINDIHTNPKLGLFEHLNEYVIKTQDKIKAFYSKAQADGHIRANVNIDFIMAYSSKVGVFMQDEKLMAQYASPKDFIMEIMHLMFYGIVSREKNED